LSGKAEAAESGEIRISSLFQRMNGTVISRFGSSLYEPNLVFGALKPDSNLGFPRRYGFTLSADF
jgi:hypothetical protein